MNQFYFPEIKKRTFDKPCRIIATGSVFPENIVTNANIISKYKHSVTDIVIQKTIGVRERRVASDDCADSDLLCSAAAACLAKAGIRPEQLSKLIVNKFIGDKALPMTASLLQKKLNCPDAIHSFDVDGGANSFLQALDLASVAINSGDSYILIVSGGINNCLANRTDPRTAFLFGDGAGAVLLGPSDKQHILSSYFFSNYEFADLFTGFTHCKNIPSDIHETKNYEILYDQYHAGNWKVAEEFILQAVKVTAGKMLDSTGLTFDDINMVLITENNMRLWQAIVSALGVQQNKTLSVIENYGNTMSAMLPVLIDNAFTNKGICEGDRVMLLSIGEGISGGGLIYEV